MTDVLTILDPEDGELIEAESSKVIDISPDGCVALVLKVNIDDCYHQVWIDTDAIPRITHTASGEKALKELNQLFGENLKRPDNPKRQP